MSAATVISPIVFHKTEKPPRRISIEKFLEKYRKGRNGYKYEWNNGIIEKTIATNQNELYISQNLMEFFFGLQPRPSGILSQEIETWTTEVQWRKPDLAYFTQAQIRLGRNNVNTVPSFVIEVISQYDPINTVNDKVIEYFNAGVKVVWHIFPSQKMVYVFTSIKNITVCMGEDICSAELAITGYSLSVNDIFK
jgi:Uma2 family endonuclease